MTGGEVDDEVVAALAVSTEPPVDGDEEADETPEPEEEALARAAAISFCSIAWPRD
jgi:hypothetical protein